MHAYSLICFKKWRKSLQNCWRKRFVWYFEWFWSSISFWHTHKDGIHSAKVARTPFSVDVSCVLQKEIEFPLLFYINNAFHRFNSHHFEMLILWCETCGSGFHQHWLVFEINCWKLQRFGWLIWWINSIWFMSWCDLNIWQWQCITNYTAYIHNFRNGWHMPNSR